ncbi:MAG: hypothetical protein LQ344_005470 [Seirophora lacunosa]|nr:MAG: hypothetical protein LQ344_005470 [Seirophora lacunosa]
MANRSARRYIKLTNYAASRLSAIPLTPIREADEMQSPNSDIEETPPMPNIYAPPSSKPTEHEIASDTHPRNTTEARNAAIRASLKHLTASFKSAASQTPRATASASQTPPSQSATQPRNSSPPSTTGPTGSTPTTTNGKASASDLEELSEALTVVIISLIETAREQQTMESVDAVRRAVGRYCEQVQGIGRDAGANAAMRAAGFEAHDHEIAMAAGGLEVEGLGEISQ